MSAARGRRVSVRGPLGEALVSEPAGRPGLPMRPLLVVFLTVLLDLVGFGIVIPLLTFYAESFDATPTQVTALMTCYSLAQFIAAPFWGQVSDRVGRRPVLLASVLLTAVMLAGFAGATSLLGLFVFRTLHGVMTANIGIAQACVADLTTPENRARGMGMIGAGFGLGFTLGPFIGGEVAAHWGLAAPFWLAAGLSLINFLLAWVLLPETRHAGSATASRPLSPLALIDAVRSPTVGLAIVLNFLMVFAFALMESTFTLFAEHAHGLGPRDLGRLFGLVGVVGIVIQGGLIGPLVRRFGERTLVPLGLAVLALGVFGLPVAPVGAPLLLTFAAIGVGQSLATPSLQGLVSRAAAADAQGTVLGSNQSMSALARALGPITGGLLFERAHGAPFGVAGAILVGAVLLAVPATARALRSG